jgi:hypothetical protein
MKIKDNQKIDISENITDWLGFIVVVLIAQ